jgi:hypothetical protein
MTSPAASSAMMQSLWNNLNPLGRDMDLPPLLVTLSENFTKTSGKVASRLREAIV